MSYLKSSLFYLKDINDFLQKKFYQYGDLGNYVTDLYTNEKEMLPFLENVIMNKHHYDLVKYTFIKDAKSSRNYYNAIRICALFFDSLVVTIIAVRIIRTLRSNDNGSVKAESCLFYVLILIVVNCILVWCASSTKYVMDDLDGTIQNHIPVETNFIDFSRLEGVAMYFALRRGFDEPPVSPYRKDIKKYYNKYVRTIMGTTQYPSISDVISNPDWKSLVDSTKYAMTMVFEIPILDLENIKGSPIGYKSNYEKIDQQITYSDNITMMKEVHNQGDSLKNYIANPIKPDVQITPDQIQQIIANEIVPIFNVTSTMYHIEDSKLNNETSMNKVSPPYTVSNNLDCMIDCELNDACLVSAFNIPSKKCTMMSTSIPTGAVLSPSTDDVLYIKSSGSNTNLFVQGNDLVSMPTGLYTSELEGDCAGACISSEQCVKYINNADGKCSISSGSNNIDYTTIQTCANSGNCAFYKEQLESIGTLYDIVFVINAASTRITNKLVNIVKNYNFEFSISENSDAITQSLRSYLGNANYNLVNEQINTLLDNAQTQANNEKKHTLSVAYPKYITKDVFIEKMNSMTFADFGSLYYSVNTLTTVVGDLNNIVQNNISKNLSGDNNIFLVQERNASEKRWFIMNISTFMLLGFAYYILYSHNNPKKQTGGAYTVGVTTSVDNVFKFTIPMVFIILTIVIMASSHQKQIALNTYNREVLEKNGGNLVNSINELDAKVANIHDTITKSNKAYALDTKIADMQISTDDMKDTYNYLVSSVDLLYKCNLLMDGDDIDLPFPWTDITVNLITITVCIAVMMIIIAQIDPVGKIKEIRELNIIVSKLMKGLPVNLDFLEYDEDDEMGTTLKIITLVVFIVMLIMFCQKLLKSSQNYKMGLYNSKYYAESKCAK